MGYCFGIDGLDSQIDDIKGGSNVLVQEPATAGQDDLARAVLSEGIERGEGTTYVSTKYSADDILTRFDDVDYDPERFGIIDCVSESQGMVEVEETPTIKTVGSPKDMTGIGIKVSELLEEFWENRGIEQNRVLMNSISTLLMYSNLQTAFRFLHVFTGRIRSVEGFGVFFIDATMHEEQEYQTLKQLFDCVVEVGEDDRSAEVRVAGLTREPTDWVEIGD